MEVLRRNMILALIFIFIVNDFRGCWGFFFFQSAPTSFSINDLAQGITHELSRKCENINRKQFSILDSSVNSDFIRMYVYDEEGFHKFDIHDAPEHLLKSRLVDPQKKTIIFVHGYNDEPYEPKIENIALKYIQRGGYNFLSFDTSEYTYKSYTWGAGLAPRLGKFLGRFIVKFVKKGVSPNDIHIIGYSLGSHIAGLGARYYTRKTGVLLPRITALEPPTLCFASHLTARLTMEDAQYVDVIHTSLLSVGRDGTGHADFYVNGNIGEQPGCENSILTCSHRRSALLYAESMDNEEAFVATKCESWTNFLNNDCPENRTALMGFASQNTTRGSYFLKTASFYPFGMMYRGLE